MIFDEVCLLRLLNSNSHRLSSGVHTVSTIITDKTSGLALSYSYTVYKLRLLNRVSSARMIVCLSSVEHKSSFNSIHAAFSVHSENRTRPRGSSERIIEHEFVLMQPEHKY